MSNKVSASARTCCKRYWPLHHVPRKCSSRIWVSKDTKISLWLSKLQLSECRPSGPYQIPGWKIQGGILGSHPGVQLLRTGRVQCPSSVGRDCTDPAVWLQGNLGAILYLQAFPYQGFQFLALGCQFLLVPKQE